MHSTKQIWREQRKQTWDISQYVEGSTCTHLLGQPETGVRFSVMPLLSYISRVRSHSFRIIQ